jgi:dextranase
MSDLDVRPERLTRRPGEEVMLLVDSATPVVVTVTVTRLGDQVLRRSFELTAGRERVGLGILDKGSYAVELDTGVASAATAVDVLADPLTRPRYGFVTDFGPDRADLAELVDSLRAFHLNVVQLYDWMHRHEDLLPPQGEFVDALGRSLSLATVRSVVQALHDVGGQAIGYAAVYGAGAGYAEEHPEQVLRHRDGAPWRLADFLRIMDVSPETPWTRHILGEVVGALRTVGFDGLHLDQYGAPTIAVTSEGVVVDLAEALPALVDAVRAELPSATLIFNHVNGFPTWTTDMTGQDVTYIEVWSPHDAYADLVHLVDLARARVADRPVVLAAYLEPFATTCGEGEVAAAKLALATVWAAGGQYLLFGERQAILTDPYYPNFGRLDDPAVSELRAFCDFAIANGDLLFDPTLRDATSSLFGGVNEDVFVSGVPTSRAPEAGSVWVRLSSLGRRLVVQLIDYRAQADARWNVAKAPPGVASGVSVRVRVVSPRVRVRGGHPGGGPALHDIEAVDLGEFVEVRVPDFVTWALVVLDR